MWRDLNALEFSRWPSNLRLCDRQGIQSWRQRDEEVASRVALEMSYHLTCLITDIDRRLSGLFADLTLDDWTPTSRATDNLTHNRAEGTRSDWGNSHGARGLAWLVWVRLIRESEHRAKSDRRHTS